MLLVGLILACPHCATSRLPDALTADQAQVVAEYRSHLTVAVERYSYPAYSESLIKALSASGLFAKVVRREETQNYDLIATVTQAVYGSATIPFTAILTIGIVPSIVHEHFGFRFSLATKGGTPIAIDAVHPSTTYLGWAAVAMQLSPNYSSGEVEDSKRYLDFLRYRIISAGIPRP